MQLGGTDAESHTLDSSSDSMQSRLSCEKSMLQGVLVSKALTGSGSFLLVFDDALDRPVCSVGLLWSGLELTHPVPGALERLDDERRLSSLSGLTANSNTGLHM